MCTETSIEYEQNKCAQKFLLSMDTKNLHRKKNDDRHDDSQTEWWTFVYYDIDSQK